MARAPRPRRDIPWAWAAAGALTGFVLALLAFDVESAMTTWLNDPAHRSDRYGRFTYPTEAVGLSRDWVDPLFDDYRERFGVTRDT